MFVHTQPVQNHSQPKLFSQPFTCVCARAHAYITIYVTIVTKLAYCKYIYKWWCWCGWIWWWYYQQNEGRQYEDRKGITVFLHFTLTELIVHFSPKPFVVKRLFLNWRKVKCSRPKAQWGKFVICVLNYHSSSLYMVSYQFTKFLI